MSESKKQAPVKTSEKKRPNKTFIQQMAEFRGHMTENEKTQLKSLEVKNALQRINNRAMSEKLEESENLVLQKAMAEFIKVVNKTLN
jgi:hypothetical protein